MKLAACLIVRNECPRLCRCLNSLAGIVDEIVVLDTGSDDGTPELAQQLGAIVARAPWTHDFSAARNQALALTDADWILWIDADEALEVLNPGRVRKALLNPDVGGYVVPIHNLAGDHAAPDILVHHTVRLFRRDPAIQFEGRVHEQIAPSIGRTGFRIAPLAGIQIRHWGYLNLLSDPSTRIERNLVMLQAELNARPNDAYTWFHLAGVYDALARDAEAEFAAQRAVDLAEEPAVLGSAAVLLAGVLLRANRPGPAIELIQRIPEGLCGLLLRFHEATARLRLGQPADGLLTLGVGRERGWDPLIAGDYGVLTYKSDVLEAQLLMAMGQPEAALPRADRALLERPSYPDAIFTRGVALAVLGRRDEAAKELVRLEGDPRLGPGALHIAAQAHFDAGRYGDCVQLMQRLWERGQCREEMFVLWTSALERSGDAAGVQKAFLAYAAIDKTSVDRLLEWVRAAAESGDLERALGYAVEALQQAPRDPEVHFAGADVLRAMGQFKDAAHLYEAGLRIAPTCTTAWESLATCLRAVGLPDAAERASAQGRWCVGEASAA